MNSPVLMKSRCTCPKTPPGEQKRQCNCLRNMTCDPRTFEPILYTDHEDPDEIIYRRLGRANEIQTWTKYQPEPAPERPKSGRARPRNRRPDRD